MFAYEYEFKELVQTLEFALVDYKTQFSERRWVSLDSILLISPIECSDMGDRRRCSRAMQVLRKKRLCSYSRRHKEWMIH
jgi:hypothetical protein